VPAAQLGEIKSLLLFHRVAIAAAAMEPTPEVIRLRISQRTANETRLQKVPSGCVASNLGAAESKLAHTMTGQVQRLVRKGFEPATASYPRRRPGPRLCGGGRRGACPFAGGGGCACMPASGVRS